MCPAGRNLTWIPAATSTSSSKAPGTRLPSDTSASSSVYSGRAGWCLENPLRFA